MTKPDFKKRFFRKLSDVINCVRIILLCTIVLSIFRGIAEFFQELGRFIAQGNYAGQEFRYAVHMPQLQAIIFKWDSAWWFTFILPMVVYQLVRLLRHFSRVLAFDAAHEELREQTRIRLMINREERSLLERTEKLGSYQSNSQRD